MIRKWQSDNADPLLSLWLESTTEAHPFISASYWKENEAMVREVYLPAAETWVWEEDGTLRGFISIIQSQFVGALFVRPTYIGQGIGGALLNHVVGEELLHEGREGGGGWLIHRCLPRARSARTACRQRAEAPGLLRCRATR